VIAVLAFLFALGLLAWAWLVRRAPADAGLLAVGGIIFLVVALSHVVTGIGDAVGILPETAASAFGIVLIVRAFISRLGRAHRIGFGAAGCIMMLPLVAFALLVALFSMGSGHDSRARTNQAAPR
jgi:hypothetical protein